MVYVTRYVFYVFALQKIKLVQSVYNQHKIRTRFLPIQLGIEGNSILESDF